MLFETGCGSAGGIAGPDERVTFHNPENGFCVLRTRVRGHRELVTVVGHAATVSPAEWIIASGEWVNDLTHGQQFRVRFIRTAALTSVEGIEKCLGSGMIRGIVPGRNPVAWRWRQTAPQVQIPDVSE